MQQPQVRTPAGTYEGLWADDAQSIQVFRGDCLCVAAGWAFAI